MKTKDVFESPALLLILALLSITLFIADRIINDSFSTLWFALSISFTGLALRNHAKNRGLDINQNLSALLVYFSISAITSGLIIYFKDHVPMAMLFVFMVNLVSGVLFILKVYRQKRVN